jgi:hypothetical protein
MANTATFREGGAGGHRLRDVRKEHSVTDKSQVTQYIHARAKESKAVGVKLGEEAGLVTYKEAIDAYVANGAAGVLMYHDGHSQAFPLVGPAHTRQVLLVNLEGPSRHRLGPSCVPPWDSNPETAD